MLNVSFPNNPVWGMTIESRNSEAHENKFHSEVLSLDKKRIKAIIDGDSIMISVCLDSLKSTKLHTMDIKTEFGD